MFSLGLKLKVHSLASIFSYEVMSVFLIEDVPQRAIVHELVPQSPGYITYCVLHHRGCLTVGTAWEGEVERWFFTGFCLKGRDRDLC